MKITLGFKPDASEDWLRDWREDRDSPYEPGLTQDIGWRFGREMFRNGQRQWPIGLGSGIPGQGANNREGQANAISRRLGLMDRSSAGGAISGLLSSNSRPRLGSTPPVGHLEPHGLETGPDLAALTSPKSPALTRVPAPPVSDASGLVQEVKHAATLGQRPEARYPEGLPPPAPFLSTHDLRSDGKGHGAFWTSREGGKRDHFGYDILATPGETMRSPLAGRIARIGNPHKEGGPYRIIDIESEDGRYTVRFFYVDSSGGLKVNDRVEVGQDVGLVQAISEHYGGGMKDHVHVELWDCANATKATGRPNQDRHCTLMDPAPWLEQMQ
ncbi:MAG: hypothetical protein HQ495_14900 [Alphaproteobacteria bacterium]|nr:hypothetical protein [Alphaproteobacteria bacterium]